MTETTAPATAPAPTATLRGHTVPLGMYIDGEWRTGAERFAVMNPANGDTLAEVEAGGSAEALEALDAACAVQKEWGNWAPRRRADLFHAAHQLMLGRKELIVDLMVLESGKPRAEAAGEFDLSAAFFLWYAEQIAHLHGTYAPGSHGGYRIVTTLEPVGPSLLITPWNFPLLMSARKAGAALAAGCTAILKSARETPLTAAAFVQVLHDAGFPKGTLHLIHTKSSASVSSVLLADERLRKVSFTGSTEVGSKLLEQAAPNVINSSMELGGDGPLIVLEDADIDLAVTEAINCKFRNAGQACVAANRIIVHENVLEEFTQKFVERTRALTVGDGFGESTVVGPVITRAQRDRVEGIVESFKAEGATVLEGGGPVEGDGNFYAPTVLQVPQTSVSTAAEEIFAPVATIYSTSSTADAIAFANRTKYGLASYVFTRDLSRAVAVAEALDFGMVGVNRGVMADPAAPFGGTKASGLGREGGHDGIRDFLEPKYIALTIDEGAAL